MAGATTGRMVVVLLHDRRLLLANAGEALLDQPREFFLPVELGLRVFLGHPDSAVASDFRGFDARPTHLLPPGNVGAPEGMGAETGEIAARCRSSGGQLIVGFVAEPCRVPCRVFGATRHGPVLLNQWLIPRMSGLSGSYERREPQRFWPTLTR
jgi:hypothetical protein